MTKEENTMTKKALEKLNSKQRHSIDLYKSMDSRNPYSRTAALAYLQGLCDSGVITETEKKALFCYITL